MSLPTMMIALEKATQKSMTRPSLSVHHTSFLWALLHELVRSTTHRFVAPNGAGLPFSEIHPCEHPLYCGSVNTMLYRQQTLGLGGSGFCGPIGVRAPNLFSNERGIA